MSFEYSMFQVPKDAKYLKIIKVMRIGNNYKEIMYLFMFDLLKKKGKILLEIQIPSAKKNHFDCAENF